jgi:glycosyltransferase involved in cell wall biosynthesis
MRVLHVLPSLDQSYGGPVRAVLDLSARAQKYGLHSEILGVGELKVPDNPLQVANIHSVRCHWRPWAFSLDLYSWLIENIYRFDGVVLHGLWSYPVAIAAHVCQRQEMPYAMFPHGMLEPWAVRGQGLVKRLKKELYWHCLEKRSFAHSSGVFFTTQMERRISQETFSICGDRLILAPYGVEVNLEQAQHMREPTHAMRILEGRSFCLFLGRVHPKKNVDFLLRAWARARLSAKWLLVIAGPVEAAYKEQLRLIIKSLCIQDNVLFFDFVAGADKEYLFSKAAWFLLPSKQENFGIAVLEGVNYGCSVAVSDQVYICESMGPGAEVLPLEQDRWVEFLSTRMIDPNWRRVVGEATRDSLQSNMNIELISEKWAKTLTQTLRGKSVH